MLDGLRTPLIPALAVACLALAPARFLVWTNEASSVLWLPLRPLAHFGVAAASLAVIDTVVASSSMIVAWCCTVDRVIWPAGSEILFNSRLIVSAASTRSSPWIVNVTVLVVPSVLPAGNTTVVGSVKEESVPAKALPVNRSSTSTLTALTRVPDGKLNSTLTVCVPAGTSSATSLVGCWKETVPGTNVATS